MLGRIWQRGGEQSGSLVCVGGSHVVAVGNAARTANADVRTVNFLEFEDPVVLSRGAYRLHPAVARAVGKRYRWMFSMVGGNVHNAMGLTRHPRPFDFVPPDEPDRPLDPKAEIIPYETIKAVLARHLVAAFHQLQALRAFAGERLTHVESPPPPPQWKMLGRPDAFFHKAIEDYGLAWPALRYRLWRLNAEVMRGFCERLGIAYLAAPRESMGPRGFMRPVFVGDLTHANSKYGALVLAQMKAQLG